METIDTETATPDVPPQALRDSARSDRSIVREMEREDDKSVRDWLDGLAADTALKVVIRRRKPMVGPNGEKIDGVLETVEDKIDEEYLRDVWGGGTYLLQVQTPKPNGGWKILRSRTVDIAGPPKMSGNLLSRGDTNATPIKMTSDAEDRLAERAFNSMHELAKEERARADRVMQQQPHGIDYAALQAFQQPLIEQLRTAQHTVAELQQQVIALTTRPPPRDELRDTLLQQAFAAENKNLEALRAQYEARIDRMRDNHDDAIKRLEDRHQKAIEQLEKRHEDEVRRLEAAHEREQRQSEKMGDMQTKSLDTANTARIEALNAEKARLERELSAAQTRIATLEAKKDQSISEKADEILKVKEALEGLGGGDEDEGKWYEKVLDLVGNSEAALKLVDKLGGGPDAAAAQQAQQLPPPGVPFQGPDGNIYVRDASGQIGIVDPRALQAQQQRAIAAARQQRRKQKPAGAPAAAPQSPDAELAAVIPQAPVRPPSAKEVKLAVSFMENAVKNGTDPVKFAATARNLVPTDVLKFIQRVGIDKFLETVAEPGSALATIRGRQFARAVAAALVGGEVMPMPVAPAPANDAGNEGDEDDDLDEDDLDEDVDDDDDNQEG